MRRISLLVLGIGVQCKQLHNDRTDQLDRSNIEIERTVRIHLSYSLQISGSQINERYLIFSPFLLATAVGSWLLIWPFIVLSSEFLGSLLQVVIAVRHEAGGPGRDEAGGGERTFIYCF